MNDCELFKKLDEAINEGAPIDAIMPLDLEGISRADYRNLLAIYMTYGQDPERRKVCRAKWEYETRGQSI